MAEEANNTPVQTKWISHSSSSSEQEELDREEIEDLILQNKTLDALIKGLTGDIEIFKNEKDKWTPTDIVRFTMQLNIMRDKKKRNLSAINEIIKKDKALHAS